MAAAVRSSRGVRPFVAALAATLTAAGAFAFAPQVPERRPDYRPAAYAITGGRVVTGAGPALDEGTVVVRDGLIEAVGPSDRVAVPADAETIDARGMVVYPGFLDLYSTLGVPKEATRSRTGAGRSVPYGDFALASTPPDSRNGLTPEFDVAHVLDLPAATVQERRKLGFTSLLTAPGGSIATGKSALVNLSGLPRRETVAHAPVGLHVSLRPPFEPPPPPGPDENPAVVRQRLRGRAVNYPMSLMGTVAHLRQAMLDADYHHEALAHFAQHGGPRPASDPALDALQLVRAKQVPIWWEANTRDEIHRALDLSAEFGANAVIVGGQEAAKAADRLKTMGVPVVLRVDFPDEPKVPAEVDYRKRELGERADPLRVLAHRAAKWNERVGTARDLAKAGVRFAFAADGLAKPETFHARVRKAIDAGLSADDAVAGLTRNAAEIAGVGRRLGTLEAGKAGNLVVLSKPYGDEAAKVRLVLVDGLKINVEKADAKGKPDSPSVKDAPKSEVAQAKAAAEATAPPKAQEDQPPSGPFVDVAAELEEDRAPRIKTGGDVLIKNATILTVSPRGTIAGGSILVRRGKIEAVGPGLAPPEGVAVIDAKGLVAMPGIIDTHSHMAIAGGVNEMSLSIVAEVRVRDVINGGDPTIYRALAGGTTTARLLHGSANTIGGQDAIIKLRHGRPGHELLLHDAKRPQGIKFALGENVTRRIGRFPNTRMGVEAVIERAFEEARAYKARRDAHAAAKARGDDVPAPRRDLRLEALAGVLDGSIKIHSHCYRSDEILMLLRVAQRHGVRVRSLQHVLEGYKVAAEIAAHGASASTFSDWWAYKVEAYDAIPFNAALLTEAGARVCIKSDSEELVRHLNLEAAKMMKYGGVSEAQALEMITLNPARELGLDHRLGSIEPGKDADIVLFNAHPFDSYARCQLALVDGEVWFQRPEKGDGFAPRGPTTTPQHEAREARVSIPINPKGAYALTGATLHPVSGPEIVGGTLVVEGGKIAAIGGADVKVPPGAYAIDLKGLDVWPGLVDAGTVVGLFEVGSLAETQDFADSAPFQPELRTSVALHPDSELVPVTRANGVLSAYVHPSGGTIAGQGCVITLDGWVPPEMVLADRAALNVNIPTYVPPNPDAASPPPGGADDRNARRRERLEAIQEEFRKALAYDKVRAAARDGQVASPSPDPRLAALVPYAKGERPVLFRAERRTEILDALKLIDTLKLKGMITGGLEAWKVIDALKAAKVPVIIAGTLRLPGDVTDPYDAPYANPARLHAAGVPFAIRSGGRGPEQATAARNLPYEAATAVAFGLPEHEALKAVTLAPARLLGVADRVGSLDVGKRADLVITAGPILQATTEVKALFLGGKPLPPESRHTRLYAQYRDRLRQVRSGQAPLGLDRPATVITGPAPTATPATGPTDRR